MNHHSTTQASTPHLHLEHAPQDLRLDVPGSAFAALGLNLPLVRALIDEGYDRPTPVQSKTIPSVLGGHDVLACAQTGTGKTAAFVLPILQRLFDRPATKRGAVRALVLSPTRELASQIAERTAGYSRHLPAIRSAVIYGGVSQRGQEAELRRGVELVVATPGRLIDLVNQRLISLADVEVLVLDEADRMLDMGFIRDVRRLISAMPKQRQTLFFSATMPRDILKLAEEILRDPVRVAITPEAVAAPTVNHVVWHTTQSEKRELVTRVLYEAGNHRAIVFARTKRGANRVCENLVDAGFNAGVIHGNKSQAARDRVMNSFRAGTTRVLVATDVAARGIDVEEVQLVINYDLPNVAESYVHRIGRTGRAGHTGAAVSFCDATERAFLADIEKLLRFRIPLASGSGTAPLMSANANAGSSSNAGAPREQSRRSFPSNRRHRPRNNTRN